MFFFTLSFREGSLLLDAFGWMIRCFFFLMDLSDVSTFKSVLFQTHLYTHRIHVYGIFTCVFH